MNGEGCITKKNIGGFFDINSAVPIISLFVKIYCMDHKICVEDII